MKRIYISGQITGLPLLAAKKTFKRVENMLKFQGFEPVNPFNIIKEKNKTWHEYMTADIS